MDLLDEDDVALDYLDVRLRQSDVALCQAPRWLNDVRTSLIILFRYMQ
jgi:hypothetical protein